MPRSAKFTPRKYTLPVRKNPLSKSKADSIIKQVLSQRLGPSTINPAVMSALGTIAAGNINSTEGTTGNKVLDISNSFLRNMGDYLKTETGVQLAKALAGALATRYAWSSLHRAYRIPVDPRERKEMWKMYYFMK